MRHADTLRALCITAVITVLLAAFGCQSSEVYSDGERFGIYWGDPVSSLFGYPPSEQHPDGDPSLVIVEDTEGLWEVVRPEAEETGPSI